MTRPAGPVTSFWLHVAGRVGTGQELFGISSRAGSAHEVLTYHGSGRVALTRLTLEKKSDT